MKKYTKKELKNIVLDGTKYLLAQFILQKMSKDNIKFLNLLKIENLGDFLIFYDSLENIEKNMLKMNVSAESQKFLKNYEKLGVQQKQKFLSENGDKLLLSAGENIQKILE